MDHVEIRNASTDDVAALAELSTQLGYPSSPQQTSDRLEAILRSSDQLVKVACSSDGSVVGWVHVFLTLRVEADPFAELGGLVVARQLHRRGIGSALLKAAEGWVACQGIKRLRVRTRSIRRDAQAFYKQLGFTKTKEQYVYDKPVGTSIQDLIPADR